MRDEVRAVFANCTRLPRIRVTATRTVKHLQFDVSKIDLELRVRHYHVFVKSHIESSKMLLTVL